MKYWKNTGLDERKRDLRRRVAAGDDDAALELAELVQAESAVKERKVWIVFEDSNEGDPVVRSVWDSQAGALEHAATLLANIIRRDRNILDQLVTHDDAEYGDEPGEPVTKRDVLEAFERGDWKRVLDRGHDYVRWAWREKHRVSFEVVAQDVWSDPAEARRRFPREFGR